MDQPTIRGCGHQLAGTHDGQDGSRGVGDHFVAKGDMMALRSATITPRRVTTSGRHPDGRNLAAAFVIPQEAVAGVAVLSLVSVTLFGPIGVIAFIAATAVLLATQPLAGFRRIVRQAPLLALPLLAIVSTAWSTSPPITMRAGLQLLLTFVAIILICQSLRPERMILMLFLGYVAICAITLPGVPHALATGQPLWSSVLGSKNQVGFAGYLMAALALAVVVDRLQPWPARLLGLLAVPAGVVIVLLSQSGGGTTSLVITLALFPALALLGAFPLTLRIGITVIAVALVGIALVFQDDIVAAIATFRTTVLNKDATLTGRTYLWDFAARLIAQRPLLGNGYGAFWRQGNVDAEGLWRWAGIANRSGFNFHNALIGIQVDLGMVGAGVLIATSLVILVAAFARQLWQPSVAMAALIGLLVVSYVRSYVEEGLVAPFSLVTMMWLATGLYAWRGRAGAPGRNLAVAASPGRTDAGPRTIGVAMPVDRPRLAARAGTRRGERLFKHR